LRLSVASVRRILIEGLPAPGERQEINVNTITVFHPGRRTPQQVAKFPSAGLGQFNEHIFLPAEAHAGVHACVVEAAERVLASEGLRAFEMPRSAALAHETGHAIVGAHEGLTIVEVGVFERAADVWSGVTTESSTWSVDANTPTATALGRARYLIAGIAGEAVLDPDNCRSGSSLDEIVLSQALLGGIWTKRRADFADVEHPSDLWQACWQQTCCIVKLNENVGRDLIRKLERRGRLYGKPLAASLRRVARFV
jgi:hypothetical protein